MTQHEAFQKMEILRPYYKKLLETKAVILPVENQMMLKDLWDNFWGFYSLNLGCPQCIIEALSIVDMNYEREYPKYVSTLITEPEAKEVVTPDPKDQATVIEPTSKKKTNGRK